VESPHQNILADFSRLIGVIGVFVADYESGTDRLKLLHGLQSFPGNPGYSRDRMAIMGFEGEVSGLDICTVAFAPTHLAITDYVTVPDSVDRVQQLLHEEPLHDMLGPFNAIDANL
jgi:hypothetical protein